MNLLFFVLFSFQSDTTLLYNKDTAYTNLDTTNNLLKEVVLFSDKNVPNIKITNIRIKRRILKVWKYAIMTQDELEKLENTLSKLDKNMKKEYLELTEGFIRNNFEDTLKKFYVEDGQILLKLIYRQTGKTALEITKEFKSSWTAFWWNTTAFFFDLSLKSEYHPNENFEDFLIEKNLQELFSMKKIEPREMKNK